MLRSNKCWWTSRLKLIPSSRTQGTGAWLIMGLLLLAESGLWAGTAAAYTAFAVMKKFSFSAGPSYSEPFTVEQQAYLRSIYQQLTTGVTGPLTVLTSPGATGIDGAFLGPWGMAENLAQANAIIQRYLDYNKKWKVSTAPRDAKSGGVPASTVSSLTTISPLVNSSPCRPPSPSAGSPWDPPSSSWSCTLRCPSSGSGSACCASPSTRRGTTTRCRRRIRSQFSTILPRSLWSSDTPRSQCSWTARSTVQLGWGPLDTFSVARRGPPFTASISVRPVYPLVCPSCYGSFVLVIHSL